VRSLASLLVVALASWPSGCRGPDAGSRHAHASPTGLRGDPAVESRLETLHARRLESARGAVLRLELRNKSTAPISFAWAVEWFDRSGRHVPGAAPVWAAMELAAGEARPIEVPVPSADATTWRLRAVRPG